MDTQRERLVQEVLEYWYTADFLNQGSLQTEITRREKDTILI